MEKKQLIILVIILAVVIFGLLIFSNMTGNIISGASIKTEIKTEYFKVDGSHIELDESLLDSDIKIINKQEE